MCLAEAMVSRPRSILASLGGALVLAGLVVAANAGTGQETTARLPDLTVQPPGDVQLRRSRGRLRLGFASAADNGGDGPLTVDGDRLSPDDRTLAATQIVEHAAGPDARLPLPARLRYVHSSDHSHWHFRGFMRYSLRNPRTGRVVARDRKTGFCLGDRYETDLREELPGEGRPAYIRSDCGKGRPRLDRVREGISVGWGDDYRAYIEGQSIDVTRLRAGRYLLVHAVNPERSLRELSYSNNVSSALLRIRRPRGEPARVHVLARCPQRLRCRR